jgi:hypothetical protein
MTIEPGMPWGRQVTRPDDLVIAHSDHVLARALTLQAGPPIAAAAGDLARTLGVRGNDRRTTINEFPIDLIEVRLDAQTDRPNEPLVACAHVIVRSPWRRGHWWRGPILAVMNAEFIGDWDVAPRGHPNDGRAEVFEVDASMSVRDRLGARRRLATGTHVPHPRITTRSVRAATWDFPRPLDVIVDGQPAGRASSLAITVQPDAANVYA